MRRAAVTCLGMLSFAGLAASQTLTSIGVLPGGGSSECLALSADGSAVTGYCAITGGPIVAIRWATGGSVQSLGFLPSGIRSLGFGISGDGSVVTGMGTVFGSGHVFRWTAAGGMEDLGTLSFQNVSYGYAISADGLVIGGGPSSGGVGHALTWDNDSGLTDLGTLAGAPIDASSALFGLSGDGAFGSGFSGTAEGKRAIRWSASTQTMEDLGVVEGGSESSGASISADGTVIVGTCETGDGPRAFRWEGATGMLSLGVVPGRGTSHAAAVSADGSVVVGTDEVGATLWTPALGMVDLKAYLMARGMNLSNWTLDTCVGVSADRTALAGTGRLNGQRRGWVVQGLAPITSSCPADLTTSSDPGDAAYGVPDGIVDASDFFFFLDAFAGGNRFVADLTTTSDPGSPGYGVPDGVIDASDFFFYLDAFVNACV